LTFMQAWDKVIKEGRFRRHDWVVKVDPDAVFFPERLRYRLREDELSPVGNFYILNCDMWGKRMFGALEVYSRGAIEAYAMANQVCKQLKWKGWGEDYYMQQCMEALNVSHAEDYKLLSDFGGHCTHTPPAGCAQGGQAAFHPMKTPGPFAACLRQAASWDAANLPAG